MAIILSSNYLFNGNDFLDSRQGIATSLTDLVNWNFEENIIPEGFEVCVQGTWYIYDSNFFDSDTGKFRKRNSGFSKVDRLEELDNNPSEVGDIVYIFETNEYYKKQTDGSWVNILLGKTGIPIYNQEILDKLGDSVPENYIYIPSESDLSGEIIDNTITTQTNGSYLDVIFSTLRQLQTEVARLRNSFKYGICSYTGTQTAMSGVISDIKEPEEEPLWAIEPDGLSIILGAEVGFSYETCNMNPISGLDIYKDSIKVIGTSSWQDKNKLVLLNKDPKLFIYSTTVGGNFHYKLSETGSSEIIKTISPLEFSNKISSNSNTVYNSLLVISRKTIDSDLNLEYGKRFLWLSISNAFTDELLLEGYIDIDNKRITPRFVEVDKDYTIQEVEMTDLILKKLEFYSKYQDFSKDVIPSKPSEDDYKYKVAHLTIRAVSNKNELESIKDQLLENELIYEEASKKLWIKNNYSLVSIGSTNGGSSSDDNDNNGMTEIELLEKLKSMGIIYEDEKGLQLSSVSDITFVHQASGKAFKYSPDSEGNLTATEIPEESLEERLVPVKKYVGFPESDEVDPKIRGFVSMLHASEAALKDSEDPNYVSELKYTDKKDLLLNSDRIKISSAYTPLESDSVFGCSHAFIELENTSNKDFPLDGCYLHYLSTEKITITEELVDKKDESGNLVYDEGGNIVKESVQVESYTTRVDHLALQGILPAGGTYLIRGKQYSNPELCPNTYINVDSFDQEWFVDEELIDLKNKGGKAPYGFALTYGQPNLTENTILVRVDTSGYDKSKSPYVYAWYYIDSFLLNAHVDSQTKPWGIGVLGVTSNSIVRNICALDPAKQAYNGLTTRDSSRIRGDKPGTDLQALSLDKEFISFPFSSEKYPISRFTPKASKLGKNISTDKSKLDEEKPNLVYTSFGIDIYKTRCFNWISVGLFDEYVWIKNSDGTWKGFQSYTKLTDPKSQSDTFPRRVEFSVDTNNIIYSRINGIFPTSNKIKEYTGEYDLTAGPFYTSHKCIIDIVETAVSEPTTFTYVVGRKDVNNQPDLDHCCSERTFTLYPESYKPKIYHTTDQQGFHWIEYQMWAASAEYLNKKINSDLESENIIPILLNTGDATQNGTRINEWLDYYRGGECLFKHLEHMAIVGNNDLVNTNVSILGTGDDIGKSNGYFFHLFNCYQVDESETLKTFPDGTAKRERLPIVNGKYVPSLYYFDSIDYRFVMCNSEITYVNCRDWFGLVHDSETYNIYTGWKVPATAAGSVSNGEHLSQYDEWKNHYISVYEMTKSMLQDNIGSRKPIVACHEMPFTVITLECINNSTAADSRSISGTSLVGCHMNQIHYNDKKSRYWFSRLLEASQVELVLGGHKHTYSATFPVREYYYYEVDGVTKNSKDDGIMIMPDSLFEDTVIWEIGGVDYSKRPLVNSTVYSEYLNKEPDSGTFSPSTSVEGLTGGVVYFMNQATGYKQTSNKELPTNQQMFSCLIPQTTYSNGAASADNNQKYPMIAIVSLDTENYNYEIDLMRLSGIADSKYKFTQTTYGKNKVVGQYAILSKDQDTGLNTRYCDWTSDEITPHIPIICIGSKN